MTDKKLTTKQQAFVAAYLRTFNATDAAGQAGYAHPRQEGTRLLSHADIKAAINDHLDQARQEGIGNRAVRLSQLNDLNDDLRRIQQERSEEANTRAGDGEALPAGASSGLMVEQTKQVGTGRNAVITTEWALDKNLVKSIQDTLEQAAREVGDRDKRLVELSGPEGGPIEIESAKAKLMELLDP